jgi:hypothetical protein
MQPLIYLPTFYTVTAVVRKWSLDETVRKVRSEYTTTLQSLWLFWTPCVIYAFGRLPKRQQAVFFLQWSWLLLECHPQRVEQPDDCGCAT